jgi:hypothetical protein
VVKCIVVEQSTQRSECVFFVLQLSIDVIVHTLEIAELKLKDI